MAVLDPFDFGAATPWGQVGGTSLATPLWAGMAAIADQGRVLAGGSTLGSTAMLTDLYDLANSAPGDFHDVTQGNNGFSAGTGYDLVTGLGTPKANLLIPEPGRSRPGQQGDRGYSAASQRRRRAAASASSPRPRTRSALSTPATTAPRPSRSPVARAEPTSPRCPSRSSMVWRSSLNLSLGNKKGNGYTFQVAMTGLTSTNTNAVALTNPQNGTGYFYPLPLSNSLGADIAAADSNGFASNIITLSVSTIPYTVTGGQLVIDNGSKLKSKTFTIVGQGESSSVVNAESTSRVFEIIGTKSLSVVAQSFAITGGRAGDGGILGGATALGGGLLIDGGNVALSNVAVMNNAASGAQGSGGAVGRSATPAHPTGGPGGNGGAGGNARGGGIYLAAGNLTLTNDLIEGNMAQGGAGGAGGRGGFGFTVFQNGSGSSFIGSFHSAQRGARRRRRCRWERSGGRPLRRRRRAGSARQQ